MSFRAEMSRAVLINYTRLNTSLFLYSTRSENENIALDNIMTFKKWQFHMCIQDIPVTHILYLFLSSSYLPPPKPSSSHKKPFLTFASILLLFLFCLLLELIRTTGCLPELVFKTGFNSTLVVEYRKIMELGWKIPSSSSLDGWWKFLLRQPGGWEKSTIVFLSYWPCMFQNN